MRFQRCSFALAATICLGAALPAGAQMPVSRREITTVNGARSYLVYVPPAARVPAGGRPLVLVLHGGMGTAEQMVRFTRFNAIAEGEGFAVAYPQGVQRRWNDGRVFRGRTEIDSDDVGFLLALIEDVSRAMAPVDRRRVFAAGISNGGFMSMRLACEAASSFAAVAAVTATMPADLGARCRPDAPISVMVINGTADPLVPYAGGHVRGFLGTTRGAIWSTDQTMGFWARANRCGAPIAQPLPDRDVSDRSRIIEIRYRGRGRAHVTLLSVANGGHTWPGAAQYAPAALIGVANQDIDASEVIWSFFKAAPPRQ